MQRSLAVVLSLLTSVCRHAAILPGAERPVAPPTVGASFGYNRLDALATDGTDFLTLWSEDTPGREGFYATVVREDGVRRPDVPVPVVRGKGYGARAVWTGDAYLVALVADEVPLVLRLDRDGRVISGPEPFTLENWAGGLAWNGRHVLATTFDYAAQRSTAALLDAHGRVVRAGIELPRSGGSTVVAAGEAFVILMQSMKEEETTPPLVTVEAIRVTDDGTVSEPLTILQQKAYLSYDVAANGDRVGIAVRRDLRNSIELLRLTLDASTMTIAAETTIAMPRFSGPVQVVASPGGFTASWSYLEAGRPGAFFSSIAFDAAAPATFAITDPMHDYTMVSNGRSAFAAWGLAPVRGMTFDAAVTRSTSGVFPVTASGVRQSLPSIAAAPDSILGAWTEDNGFESSDVMVRRFDRAGSPLGQPLRIASNAWSSGNTAVAFTGRAWLVAWMVGSNAMDMRISMRRLALDGTPLDAQPLDLGPGWYPALASNGTATILGMTTEQHKAMAVVRFSPEGERIDAQPVVVHPQRGYSPSIATNGRELLMVWETSPIPSPNPYGIIGLRFDESGALLDTAPILIATTDLYESKPHVASDGTDFLVVYSRTRREYHNVTPFTPTVHAKRVLRTGVLADATAEQPGPYLGTGGETHVAPLGPGYVVTFARVLQLRPEAYAASMFALRVDANGAVTEGARELPTGESYEEHHALVAVGNAVMLVYPRVEPSLANVQRVYLRTIGEDEAPRRRAVRR